jgi:hypothetical protein
MSMFTLYCDDSGTHAESPFAVAACFVAPILQWEHFAKDWKAADGAEGFGVFHMADFVARKKQFAAPEWQDDDKRKRTLKRLINIINTRRRMGFFAAVEKSGYDAQVPQAMRDRYRLGNNHYSFAVRMCMAKVLKWRMKYGYKEPIEFVFDQMSKGAGEINAIFEKALKEGDEAALIHGISRDAGWSFQSKTKVVPLQGADILAWEALYHMQKAFLARGKTERKSFQALIETAMDPGYHDCDTLRKWVAHVRARTNATW